MSKTALAPDLERRKQVRLRLRPDLVIAPHRYEGRIYYIVKDPVSLRYYRFKEQEHFLIQLMDGTRTLDDAQKEFEKRFRPERLTLEDLEGFAQQLLTVGLAHNESPQAGKQLFDRRKKRKRHELVAALTNILYIKIPIIDPDRLLDRMLPYFRFIFTTWFFILSVLLMLSAVLLVATHFTTFRDKLPSYHEFFSFKTVAYLWIALGVVKVIHEFGHGLSCKAFGGEVHEMGALFLCFSPCLYCNVSDAWTLPSKWKRIIISFAGIYVELVIAAIATFVWWNTPANPFVNNLSLSLMVVCSVSTVVFNGNPLMRFDGYYMLADWMEIPNLRDRANRYLKNLTLEYCMGVEVQPEQYMTLWRKVLFVLYAVVSYIYRWVITFSILYFLSSFLGPKLRPVSQGLALMAAGSMVGWPLYRLGKGLHKRGRLPDMKSRRLTFSLSVLAAVLAFVFLVPLPIVSRVRETALVEVEPDHITRVFTPNPGGILEEIRVKPGQWVQKNDVLARFRNLELENRLAQARTELRIREVTAKALEDCMAKLLDKAERNRVSRELATARGEEPAFHLEVETLQAAVNGLTLRSPRDGVVMSPPLIDAVGKRYDPEQEQEPFCSIADPSKVRAVVPVPPDELSLLREEFQYQKDRNRSVTALIRVQGRDNQTWEGTVPWLPESEAKEVPIQLTTRAGGPLAIKPGAEQNKFVPQAQQYLVPVTIQNPDAAICPGTLAKVKIGCRWHTCAWWLWRSISSTFDLGLL